MLTRSASFTCKRAILAQIEMKQIHQDTCVYLMFWVIHSLKKSRIFHKFTETVQVILNIQLRLNTFFLNSSEQPV